MAARIVGDLACQRDSYLQTLESHVVACEQLAADVAAQPKEKVKSKGAKKPAKEPLNIWLIEFADSVLFPEGGGQPSDHGTITPLTGSDLTPIAITFVQRLGLRCVYHSSRPLEIGTRVRQDIDFTRRWDHMQQHTGQHVLSAVMDKLDHLETLGWGMGSIDGMNYVDLERRPSEAEMQSIQDKCNEAVRQNLEVSVDTSGGAKADSLPGDYDKEKGIVRVIKIGDLDANPCCGTHLRQTSHISLILLGATQPVHTTACRMSFMTGERAIRLATSSVEAIRSIAKSMSSSTAPADVVSIVAKTRDSAAEARKREARLTTEVAEFVVERVKTELDSKATVFVHRPEASVEFVNLLVAGLKSSLAGGKVVVFSSGESGQPGQIVVMGDESLIKEYVSKIKETVPEVKGGGKGRWQGKVEKWQKGQLDVLRKSIETA